MISSRQLAIHMHLLLLLQQQQQHLAATVGLSVLLLLPGLLQLPLLLVLADGLVKTAAASGCGQTLTF